MSDISADCIPEGFDAFSSHCAHNGGYSGVITYVRKEMLPSRVYYSFEKYFMYYLCDLVFLVHFLSKASLLFIIDMTVNL